MCAQCGRNSTIFHKLEYVEVITSELAKRNFGRKLLKESVLQLCVECRNYLTSEKPDWIDAWPSVIFSFSFTERTLKHFEKSVDFLAILPYQLQASWFTYIEMVGLNHTMNPLFRDLTNNIKHFFQLLSTHKGNNYISAMNLYSYPSIRCICGASTHLDTCGSVSFQHLLNYLDPSFVSFQANCTANVNCMRNDFFEKCDGRIVFELRPSIKLSEKGLVLLTCEQHDKGSSLKLMHVARHPLVGNLSHPHADRLAPVACSLREATPFKIGEFSNTWTLSKSVAGKDGAGSLVLHSQRSFCVKSQSILPGLESTFLNNRKDMAENVAQIATENFLPAAFFTRLSTKLNTPKLFSVMQSATVVPQSTINHLKEFFETTDGLNTAAKCFRHMGSNTRDFLLPNTEPVLPSTKICRLNTNVAALLFYFLNVTSLSDVFITKQSSSVAAFKGIFSATVQNSVADLSQLLHAFYDLLPVETSMPFVPFLHSALTVLEVPTVAIVESLRLAKNIPSCKEIIVIIPSQNCWLPQMFTTKEVVDFHLISYSSKRVGSSAILYKKVSDMQWFEVDIARHVVTDAQPTFDSCCYGIFIRNERLNLPLFDISREQKGKLCPEHKIQFCIELTKALFLCSFDANCILKVWWRCPVVDCGVSLCRKHYEVFDNSSSLTARQAPPIEYDGPSGSSSSALHVDTDAGSTHMAIENDETTFGEDIVSMHALLNNISPLLQRREPIQATKQLKRFFQRFLCFHPSSSCSLVQLEALLFPSIFFYQLDDGSFPGAIPFFLYGDEKACNSFGFQSLLQHFTTRITDPTLLTSSNSKYLQYAADALLNLSLTGQLTQDYVKRGIQSIELDKPSPHFEKSCNNFSSDTEMRVDELAAAMRSNPVTLFLTLTCNQKEHPGVAPLRNAIDASFGNASDEEKKSAVQAYMPTFVRNWSRAVKYLVELLLHSEEFLLGKIEKLWGRAEFQTLAGNLQHYHFLLWLLEGSVDLFDLVQSSEKNILHALLKVADSSLNLIKDEIQLYEVFDECVRMHTHSCEQSGGRCKKRKDLDGNKICRTPPYPPSNCHWKLNIDTQYPHEALKVLEKIDLAEKVPGTSYGLRATGELKCEKVMYAASHGEHILPTCAPLFCITKSSTNLLLTTQRFACSYLSTYTTKTEEHSDGSLCPSADGKSFRLRTEGIQNKFLASAKILRQLERESERQTEKVECRLISLTESVFWTLGLPYVVTTMDFVHIQNVPPEQRFVKKFYTSTIYWQKTQYTFFRDDISNLHHIHVFTDSQKTMATDIQSAGQADDAMSSFSIRPPELLCVDNLEKYSSWFVYEPQRLKVADLKQMFSSQRYKPWVNARGWQVKLRPSAVNHFRIFLENNGEAKYAEAIGYNLEVLQMINIDKHVENVFMSQKKGLSKTNAEVVFSNVNPKRTIDFLVSFVLRFGKYENELDLFATNSLLDCYVRANILQEKVLYSEEDLMLLLSMYVRQQLIFIPGGSLSFSSKLLSAKTAFSTLLQLECAERFETPVVLIAEMRERINDVVDTFFKNRLEEVFTSLARLKIPNLPLQLHPYYQQSIWRPQLSFETIQSIESRKEQTEVSSQLIEAITKISLRPNNTFANNHLVIG